MSDGYMSRQRDSTAVIYNDQIVHFCDKSLKECLGRVLWKMQQRKFTRIRYTGQNLYFWLGTYQKAFVIKVQFSLNIHIHNFWRFKGDNLSFIWRKLNV